MLIRLGYEIAIECSQPTPLISLLEIHHDRQVDIKRQTSVLTSPAVPNRTYRDAFGNLCRRFVAPAGSFRILYDAVIEDSGRPDEDKTLAAETPVEKLPDECLGYLLGSRYCETDHMSSLAWSLFGHLPAGWARVQAISDYVHNRLSFGYGYARATRTAAQAHEERVGVCRDFAHLAITLCRCMNIPARYVNGYLGDIGVPPDPAPMDFSRLVRSLSRRQMVHVRRPPQHAPHRPRRGCARPRRDRRAAAAQLRPAPADDVQGVDPRAGRPSTSRCIRESVDRTVTAQMLA